LQIQSIFDVHRIILPRLAATRELSVEIDKARIVCFARI
jgi:hypothetical protein